MLTLYVVSQFLWLRDWKVGVSFAESFQHYTRSQSLVTSLYGRHEF